MPLEKHLAVPVPGEVVDSGLGGFRVKHVRTRVAVVEAVIK